jgi:hypothetical protein
MFSESLYGTNDSFIEGKDPERIYDIKFQIDNLPCVARGFTYSSVYHNKLKCFDIRIGTQQVDIKFKEAKFKMRGAKEFLDPKITYKISDKTTIIYKQPDDFVHIKASGEMETKEFFGIANQLASLITCLLSSTITVDCIFFKLKNKWIQEIGGLFSSKNSPTNIKIEIGFIKKQDLTELFNVNSCNARMINILKQSMHSNIYEYSAISLIAGLEKYFKYKYWYQNLTKSNLPSDKELFNIKFAKALTLLSGCIKSICKPLKINITNIVNEMKDERDTIAHSGVSKMTNGILQNLLLSKIQTIIWILLLKELNYADSEIQTSSETNKYYNKYSDYSNAININYL